VGFVDGNEVVLPEKGEFFAYAVANGIVYPIVVERDEAVENIDFIGHEVFIVPTYPLRVWTAFARYGGIQNSVYGGGGAVDYGLGDVVRPSTESGTTVEVLDAAYVPRLLLGGNIGF
jgi:hypothetical protein